MIVTGSENVYPAEVERVVIEHPDVLEVAVVGAPDEKWGETIAAYVVLAPSSALRPEDLVEWSRDKIAGYKRPRKIIAVDELPKNASGKTLRRQLRARLWEGQRRMVG